MRTLFEKNLICRIFQINAFSHVQHVGFIQKPGDTEKHPFLFIHPDQCVGQSGFGRELKETGVAGVVMAEPAAGLMSDEDCERFSSVFVKRVVDAVQDDCFSVVLHNCGNTGQCTHAMAVTGAAIYHFGNKIDMVEAIKGVPADTLAVGNIEIGRAHV